MKKSTMTSMLKSFSLTVLVGCLFLSAGCDSIFKQPTCTCLCNCREDTNPNQITEKCGDDKIVASDPNACGDACDMEDTNGVDECSPPGVTPEEPPTPPCAQATFYFCLVCGDEAKACGTEIDQSACTQAQATSIVDTTTAGDVDDDNNPCDVDVGPCGTDDADLCISLG
jgi:hypothetical protein